MKVVVDTSVWSLALRRRQAQSTPETEFLSELITEGRAVLLGIVRQEILSGVREITQFERLRKAFAAFEDFPASSSDHETAAELCNQCLAKGVQAGNTDFLICAIALNHNMEILSTDKDFISIAGVIPIQLHAKH